MRRKIKTNQEKVDNALNLSNLKELAENKIINELLKMDLFFPKKKLKGVVLEIYRFWESWIIRKHVKRSMYFRNK